MKFFHCVQTLRETWFDELVWEAPSLNVPSVFGHCGWGDCKRMNKFPYWQGTFQKGASLSNSHEQLNFLITRLQIVHIARFWKLLYGNIVFAYCLNRKIANCQTRIIICEFRAWLLLLKGVICSHVFQFGIDLLVQKKTSPRRLELNFEVFMTQLQMFQKVEYGWGPIFKVVLEC